MLTIPVSHGYLLRTGVSNLPVRLRATRWCRPTVLGHHVAATPRRARLDGSRSFNKLRVALGLIEADRGQGCDDILARLLGGHLLGRTTRHPPAPGEADNAQRDCSACCTVKSWAQPFWGFHKDVFQCRRKLIFLLEITYSISIDHSLVLYFILLSPAHRVAQGAPEKHA